MYISNIKLKLQPYTVCVWVLMFLFATTMEAQTYYDTNRSMEHEDKKLENKNKNIE